MLRTVFAALAFVLLFTAPAGAEPISAIVAALSSWWAGASIAVKLIVGLAVNVGVGLLEQYRARKAAANQPRGVTLQVQMGDTLPRSYLIGARATAGARKYIGVWGSERKTPNAYLVDVRELSCLPSRAGATGLQSVRIGDKYVTVLWAEPHADGRGYPVEEYRKDGKDYLWIKYLDGTQTAADPYLIAKFGAHADRPWKATMVGRGCQAVIMTMRRNDKLFKQGLPAALFEPKPMPLYDVRKDSTAGGSGAHRWDNPATWEPADNLPMMIYNVARGLYYGGRWVHGGRNFAAHRLPASSWMAALNEGDRDMGSGRRQFRGGLEVTVDTAGLEIIDKMRLGCAGRISEIGGALKLLVGAPAAAVFAITDETILVTREQDYEPFPSIRSVSNTIRGTYPEPAQGWSQKDAPERTSTALLARDDGQELAIDVDFDAVSIVAQVQCLMATMIEEAQRWRVHQVVLPPSARVLEPGIDVISYTSEYNSYGNKKFIIERIARLPGCLWQAVIRELDPSDYDPPTIILPPVVGPTGPIDIPDQVMEGFTAVKSSIDDGVGAPRRPAIRIGVEPELEDIVAVHVRIRVKQTGAVVFDNSGSTPYPAPGTGGVYSWLLAGTWCVPAGTYLVRGRLIPGSQRETLWSDEIEVTVDNLGIATDDILDGAIKELKIADRAVKSLKIALDAVKAELIANDAVIASKIANAAVTTAKFAAGIEPVSIIPGTTVPTTKTTEVVMVNGKLYRWNGTAYKAEIDASDIAGTLLNAQIESLAASKITGQMTDAQIAAVAAAKVTGQFVASQIADAAVTTAKFAAGIKPVEILSALPGTPHVEGRMVYLTTDNKLYRNTGSGWLASVAASDISGQVQAAQIAALEATKLTGQITETQIDNGAISTPKIAAGAVIAGKIAAGAVQAAAIAAGAVTTDKLDALAVTAEKLAAGSVVAGKIAAAAVSATEIAAGAIIASKLAVTDFTNLVPDGDLTDPGIWVSPGWSLDNPSSNPNNIESKGHLRWAAGAPVKTGKAFSVTPGREYYLSFQVQRVDGDWNAWGGLQWLDKNGVALSYSYVQSGLQTGGGLRKYAGSAMAPENAVQARWRYYVVPDVTTSTGLTFFAPTVRLKQAGELIVDGAIIANHLATNSVTTAKIAAGAVTANEIATNAVTAVKISAGAVETAKIAAGAVVASTIASGAVTTAKLDALAVTADKLAANSVVAGKIAAAAVSATEIAAGAIIASKLALGNFTNMVPDSEFQDAQAWLLSTGGTITTSTTSYGDGAKGMLWTNTVLDDGTTSAYLVGRTIGHVPVVAGRQYLYKYSCRRYNPGTAIVRMAFWWYDSAGELVGSGVSLWSTVTSSAPQAFSGTVTVPSGVTQMRVGLHIRGDSTSGVIFRSIGFNEMNAGELIVDGTIYSNALATNAVTTAKIAAGAITAVELGAGAVTAIKIAAGAVTAEKMSVSSLAAISANFGNATFSGYAQSANGKMKLDFNAGTIEIFS